MKALNQTENKCFLKIFIVIVIFLASCSSWNISNPIYAPTDFRTLSVKGIYPLIVGEAKKWHGDAYLSAVYSEYRLQFDKKPLSITFGFRSKTEPDLWLNIYVDESSAGYSIETDAGKFSNPRPPNIKIVPDELPFDSMEALIKAYEFGGRDFFVRYGTPDWPFILHLEQRIPAQGEGNLTWKVHFGDTDFGNMFVFIDAETGGLVEIRESSPIDGIKVKTPKT